MHALSPTLGTLLTIVFGISGALCLRRCLAGAGNDQRVGAGNVRRISRANDAAHVLMSADMTAMVWLPRLADPWDVQLIAFALACCWFALQATGIPLTASALWPGRRATATRPEVALFVRAPSGSCGATHDAARLPRRAHCLHNAILMGVMAWMLATASSASLVASMPALSAATPGSAAPTSAGPNIAGLNMTGATVTGSHAAGLHMAGMDMPGTSSSSWHYVALVIAIYCLLAAPFSVMAWAHAQRNRRTTAGGRGADEVPHVLMTAGMGAMLLAMW